MVVSDLSLQNYTFSRSESELDISAAVHFSLTTKNAIGVLETFGICSICSQRLEVCTVVYRMEHVVCGYYLAHSKALL